MTVSETGCSAFHDAEQGQPPVRGFLHTPAAGAGDVLVLTHGAGGNCQTPLLVALAISLAASGVSVLRMDLPFRQLRPKGPPSASSAARDQQGLRRAVVLMRGRYAGQVFLGGKSYGGRQASLLASSEADLVDGLLLLSYPLHPPGRPTQMRTAHFPKIGKPALFVHGVTDPFASSAELVEAARLIPAPVKVLEVPGAGHSLLTRRNADDLSGNIVQELLAIFCKSKLA